MGYGSTSARSLAASVLLLLLLLLLPTSQAHRGGWQYQRFYLGVLVLVLLLLSDRRVEVTAREKCLEVRALIALVESSSLAVSM